MAISRLCIIASAMSDGQYSRRRHLSRAFLLPDSKLMILRKLVQLSFVANAFSMVTAYLGNVPECVETRLSGVAGPVVAAASLTGSGCTL